MNNSIFLTAIFLITGTFFSKSANADDKPGSTKNKNKVSVEIYPNPVTDFINVTFSKPIQEPIVETFNVNGQRVPAPSTGQGEESNKTEIDLSGLAPGIYFLKVFSGIELIHVHQIIKQ